MMLLMVSMFMLFSSVFAQDTTSTTHNALGFSKFEKQWNEDINKYLDQTNDDFSRYVKNHWEKYKVFLDSIKPKKKPEFQPVIKKKSRDHCISEKDTLNKHEGEKRFYFFADSIPEKNDNGYHSPDASFMFYGEKSCGSLLRSKTIVSRLNDTTIKEFMRHYCKDSNLRKNVADLYQIFIELNLNDFGCYLLVNKATNYIFKNNNERVLFTWLFLGSLFNKDVKLGYDQEEAYCIAACDDNLFNYPYIIVGKVKYYILLAPGQRPPSQYLSYYDIDRHVKSTPLSITIQQFPKFNNRNVTHLYLINQDTLKINTNLFLMEYLNDYPQSELKYYFNAPISEKTLTNLDQALSPLLQGKNDVDKINILLSFFHKSFKYMTDQKQFGKEKYMFGDEALFYNYTDCEDRAILFSHLVYRYTGLPVIGLDYPNHVSVGVCFHNPIDGKPVNFRNSLYYICDPTILNADAGEATDAMNNTRPAVIEINLRK